MLESPLAALSLAVRTMAKKRPKGEEDEHNRKTHTFSTRQTTMIEFPVIVPITVRWGDMDAFGHVNNTCYFRYFEQARMAYFQQTMSEDPGVMPDGVGPILHTTSCRFRAPVKHPDTLHVGARVRSLEQDRFEMVYRVYSEQLDRIAADGEALIVAYDYANQAKGRMPAEWINAIEALEGRKLLTDG